MISAYFWLTMAETIHFCSFFLSSDSQTPTNLQAEIHMDTDNPGLSQGLSGEMGYICII
jgi:hypothetical protein